VLLSGNSSATVSGCQEPPHPPVQLFARKGYHRWRDPRWLLANMHVPHGFLLLLFLHRQFHRLVGSCTAPCFWFKCCLRIRGARLCPAAGTKCLAVPIP